MVYFLVLFFFNIKNIYIYINFVFLIYVNFMIKGIKFLLLRKMIILIIIKNGLICYVNEFICFIYNGLLFKVLNREYKYLCFL